jgi:PAS domain S-box-containing protein
MPVMSRTRRRGPALTASAAPSRTSRANWTVQCLWTLPPDGVAVHPIAAWCDFTGQAPDATVGTGWTDVVHPGDRRTLLDTLAAAVTAREPHQVTCRVQRADGEWRAVDLAVMPMCAPNGTLRHWVVCCTDTSELRHERAASKDALAGQRAARRRVRDLLKKARAELRRQQEVLRQEHVALRDLYAVREANHRLQVALQASEAGARRLVEASLIGAFVADDDHIVEANDEFARQVGYTSDDLRAGQLRVRDVTPAEYAALGAQARQEMLDCGACTPLEMAYMRKDGTAVPVLMGAALLKREPLHWVGFSLDLTERHRLEREREAARASELAAEHVAQQLDQFFALAAHDIRTPVTTLSGNLELAQRLVCRLVRAKEIQETPDLDVVKRLAELLERADASSVRLSRLVTLLFDVTSARLGTLTLDLAPCDLVVLVHERVCALQETVPGRTLHLDLPAEQVGVEADDVRLGQVLTNYLTNALKYSPPDQPVLVRLQVASGQARVAVQDHGPGLSDEDQRRVWELYYRAPGVVVHDGLGVTSGSLGMGLYVCKRLVELHPGGQVGVESVVGEGSTFWFTLPLAPTPSTEA